jgi:hypothetical protein
MVGNYNRSCALVKRKIRENKRVDLPLLTKFSSNDELSAKTKAFLTALTEYLGTPQAQKESQM